MMAIFAPADVVAKLIEPINDVSLAALNGTHIVVSGTESAIGELESQLATQKIRTKLLQTSHAFHSALMEPALKPFQDFANGITFNTAQLPLICNVSGKPVTVDQTLDGAYWASHIREAVRFSDGIEAATELGCELILELGPQSVLTRMAAANWKRPSGSLISCFFTFTESRRTLKRCMTLEPLAGYCCQRIRSSVAGSGARTNRGHSTPNITPLIHCWEDRFHWPALKTNRVLKASLNPTVRLGCLTTK